MDNLPDLDGLARTLPVDQLPDLLGRLATAQGITLGRLLTPAAPAAQSGDVLLDAEEVARRLSQSVEWVYRHSSQLGARRNGRSLRFSSAALDRYIARAR